MEAILVYGVVASVIFALTAIGFSLTFGISRVANFAMGGLYLFAAYFPWLLIKNFDLPYAFVAILSILVTACLGALIYWGILLRVRGIMLAEVISTFAIGIAMLELIRAVGLVGFGAKLQPWVDGNIPVGDMIVDYQRLFIIGIGVLLVIGLWLFTRHTKMGLAFRAIAQNERTALALGMESDWVAMWSMVVGSALIAIGAVTIFPLEQLQVDKGYEVLVMALTVGIVGGIESTAGIVLASFILGFLQVIVGRYIGTAWVMVVNLAAIVIVLAIRPSGLLGRMKELEERV
jgi:branched-chain amino acid transport system permease protein